MHPNAIYIGPLKACIGRHPNLINEPELYPLKGIQGFAYQSADNPKMWVFHIDGYSLKLHDYAFRVLKEHLRFI